MRIKIRFLSTFHEIRAENIDLEVPPDTSVLKLLEILKEKFGENFSNLVKIPDYLMIFINDVNCRQLQGFETRLKEGDRVTLGHILAGGSLPNFSRSSAI